jgi:hypothetical protein
MMDKRTYLLADGTGEDPATDVAARTALDAVHVGFREMREAPHADDARARLEALATLCMGTFVANYELHESPRFERPAGVSLVGVAVRGDVVCLVRAGSAYAHRLGRRGVTELVDPSSPPSAPLGLAPDTAARPFAATWEPGDVIVLSCGSLVDAIQPKVIGRTVLETANLSDAAREIVAMTAVPTSLALVRWQR